jgi:hypothetical protein
LAANSDHRTERDAGGAGGTSGNSEDEVDHSDSDTDSDWSWDDDSDDSDTDSDWSWDDDSDDSDVDSDWSWDDDSDDSDVDSDWSQDDSDDSSSDGDSDATFQIGIEVESTAQLNVRASAAGRWKATVDAGTTGWVKDGYVTADLHGRSYTWWKVEWDTGYNRVTGWCVETYIEKASNYGSSSFW